MLVLILLAAALIAVSISYFIRSSDSAESC